MTWLISKALMQAYKNSPYLQELAVESWVGNCSDGEQFAPSSGSHTQQAYLLPVKTTDAWSRFPSGITLSPLTESRGQDVLTWFLEGFPARTLAQQGRALGLMESAAECGEKWHGSLAKYDPDLSLWKTAQCLLLGGLEPFSETWPRWGLMRHGECWELGISLRLISENEYGFWPTPVKTDGFAVGWCETSIKRKESGQTRPSGAVIGSGLKYDRRTYPYLSHGKPNPKLTEWLMGWPVMWTDLQQLEMDKFPEWLQQHGECLEGQ